MCKVCMCMFLVMMMITFSLCFACIFVSPMHSISLLCLLLLFSVCTLASTVFFWEEKACFLSHERKIKESKDQRTLPLSESLASSLLSSFLFEERMRMG